MREPGELPGFEPAVGLCSVCRFARPQPTERGSRFWRCRLAESDERFMRYPPLPVRRCPGFAAAARD